MDFTGSIGVGYERCIFDDADVNDDEIRKNDSSQNRIINID